jgi:phage host-nuclease inhibitor protein Gam
MTRLLAALPVLFLGAVIAGCSSGGKGQPAVCSSADALQASVADLRDVQVTDNGMAALQDAVASVEADLSQVRADATSQYAPQVDRLKADVDALQSAAGAAVAAPSPDTLRVVGSSISTLADDTTGFADDVAATC